MKYADDLYTLPSGAALDAEHGILGIGPGGAYIGRGVQLHVRGYEPTLEDRREIGEHAIKLWREWLNLPKAFRPDERFVPERVTGESRRVEAHGTLRKVWRDDLARTLWIAWRWKHIVSQYFDEDCLRATRALRAKPPATPAELRMTMCRACGMRRTWDMLAVGQDEPWFTQLFPLLRDGRLIPYEVDVPK